MGVSGPVYVPLCPGQPTFRKDSQNFDKIKLFSFYFLKNENGGIGIFFCEFLKFANETHLLFSSALELFLQITFSDNSSSFLVPGLISIYFF